MENISSGAGRGERVASTPVPFPTPVEHPDPEVAEKAKRRQFSAAYKLRMLQEAEGCRRDGELGALLRREGLYSSHLSTWRQQRDQGLLVALAPRRRGRVAASGEPAELTRLRSENEHLRRQLAAAETVIEIQKKVSTLLGLTQPSEPVGVAS
jgi:transposase-like protein